MKAVPSFAKGLILINVAVLLAGPTGLYGKILAHLPLGVAVCGRSAFAAVAMGLYLKLTGQRFWMGMNQPRVFWGTVVSGALLALHWFLFFDGIERSTVAIGVLTFSAFPLFVTFIEPWVFKTKLHPFELVAAALAFWAISLIVPPIDPSTLWGGSASVSMVWGAFIGLLSGVVYAIYAVQNKLQMYRLSLNESAPISVAQLTFYQNAVAALLTAPWIFSLKAPLTSTDLGHLALLGVAFTALLQALFIASLGHIKAQLVGMVCTLEPLYSMILAMIFLQEHSSLQIWLGGLLLMGAVIMAIFTTPSSSTAQTPGNVATSHPST